MPTRPGNPSTDRNMAGVRYKSDAPQDQTANADVEQPVSEVPTDDTEGKSTSSKDEGKSTSSKDKDKAGAEDKKK